MSTTTTGFTTQVVEANGIRFSVAVGGSGPTMVLLHGWPQTGRAWQRVMPALAEDFTVVVPDLRGAGETERPEGGYAKTDQARDMRALLDALELPRPASVVGHDIGAMVAFAWAAAYPEDVSNLVLLDALLPGFGLDEAFDARTGMWHFGFFAAPWPIPEMLFDGHELEFFSATFTQLSTPGTFSDEDLRAYAEAYRGRDRLRGGFEQYRTLLADGEELRRLLAGRPLPMPVLAIGGEARTGTAAGDALRDVAADLTTTVAPTGHFVAEEDPAWTVRQLREAAGPRRP